MAKGVYQLIKAGGRRGCGRANFVCVRVELVTTSDTVE
jgi:hypothetical protein